MTNLKIFNNETFGEIRVMMVDDIPTFNLYDVGFALGYKRANAKGTQYLRKDKLVNICESLDIKGVTLGVTGIKIDNETDFENTYIKEDDLYDLIFESKAKHAREFRKWITSEVIPTINKTGGYVQENREEEFITNYFPSFSEEVKLAMVQDLLKTNKELTVKASNWDKFLDTNSTYTFTEVAKMISTEASNETGSEVKISNQGLTKYLREKSILSKNKSGKSYTNHPNIEYEQYFDVISRQVNEEINKSQTRVKSNGVGFIYSILLEDGFNTTINN